MLRGNNQKAGTVFHGKNGVSGSSGTIEYLDNGVQRSLPTLTMMWFSDSVIQQYK